MPSDGYVAEAFYHLGFGLVHHDQWISVLTRAGPPHAIGHLQLPLTESSVRSLVIQSLRGLAGAAARPFAGYEPFVYSSNSNPISWLITQGREAHKSLRTVSCEEVLEFYRFLLGQDDLPNSDAQFLNISQIDRPILDNPLQ